MVLINCANHHKGFVLYFEEPDTEKKEQAVWSEIDKAFSEPVTPNDRVADYVPTQILAEFFKTNGFDGIFYKSSLGEGNNVVLFDIESAILVNCNLFESKKISFDFHQAANPYSIKR